MGAVWGAVAVAAGSYLGAQAQSGASEEASKNQKRAAEYAANLQYQASLEALQFQRDALNQARLDFAPYLQAGTAGLYQLSTALPQYVQSTIMPMAQRYGAYIPSALPSANFSINPVTGQVTSLAQQGQGYVQPPTQQYSPVTPPAAPEDFPVDARGRPTTPRVAPTAQQPEGRPLATRGVPPPNLQQQAVRGTDVPVTPQTPTARAAAPGTPTQMPMTSLQAQGQYAMPATASQADLTQGGVLAPTVPTIAQDLNYQFNTEDPVYQQKLVEKNRQIDAFLAKQGLQGSSAGESFRQEQINRLLAEEESRQYERAKTERDYATQTTAQQYGLEAQRGDTLYGRLYGQQTDLYNRMLQGGLVYDEQQLGALGRQYSLAQDVYGTLYGGAQAQANYGLGAAGSVGSATTATGSNMANTSMQAGQGMGQAALYAGNAAAQGNLAQGQAWSGFYQSMGQLGGGLINQYAYGAGGGYNPYGGYNYYGGGAGYDPTVYTGQMPAM